MKWTHQVVKHEPDEDGFELYEMCEVWYDEGKPVGWSKPFVMGETLDGLIEVLGQMLDAAKQKKVLEKSEFPAIKSNGSFEWELI